MNAALFSRHSDEWRTPRDLYEVLDAEFGFRVDAAASASNHLCPVWYGDRIDALTLDSWATRPCAVFLNPPYSRVAAFMRKAAEEARKGCTVVALVPARTETRWFQDLVAHAAEIRFLIGRLRFGGGPHSAPFPSCVAVFRPGRCAEGPRVRWWRYQERRGEGTDEGVVSAVRHGAVGMAGAGGLDHGGAGAGLARAAV